MVLAAGTDDPAGTAAEPNTSAPPRLVRRRRIPPRGASVVLRSGPARTTFSACNSAAERASATSASIMRSSVMRCRAMVCATSISIMSCCAVTSSETPPTITSIDSCTFGFSGIRPKCLVSATVMAPTTMLDSALREKLPRRSGKRTVTGDSDTPVSVTANCFT